MKLFCQRITLVFTSQGTCSQSKYIRFQNTGYCWHYKNWMDFYVSVLQVFACKTCNPLFLDKISWLGTVCPHVMFTFKSIPVKSKSVFFPLLFTTGGTVEILFYSMIEQKKFYSIAYSEQNIHETHKSILNKKQRQKAQIKREGTKKSTTFLYLISAIFRVRPHVFINIASDIIQGDAPGIKPLGMSDPPLAIINCDVPAASIHGFKEGTSGHVADGHKPSTLMQKITPLLYTYIY